MSNLIFNPVLYLEYPYHWTEIYEDGCTHIIFSKKPQYSLIEISEFYKKIEKLEEK